MANALGIDLGAVQQARQVRQANELTNSLNQAKLDAIRQQNALAPKVNALSQSFSTGDLSAKRDAAVKMGQYDPERAKQMYEMYSKLSEEDKAQKKEQADIIAKHGVGLLQIQDPQKFDAAYVDGLTRLAQRYGTDIVADAPDMSRPYEERRAWAEQNVNDAMSFQETVKAAEPQDRKIVTGADGYQYYADDESRVLPNVQKEPDKVTYGQPIKAIGPDGNPVLIQVGKDGSVRPVEGYSGQGSGMRLESDGQGGFTLTQGDLSGNTQGLSKSAESSLQKELASLEEQAARVASIDKRYNADFMTYQGGFQAMFSRLKDKANIDLTDDERNFLKDFTKFRTLVNREFNSYRREITGAAAAIQELESLKKATINEDQSPAQFEANMDVYKEELQRSLRIKRRLLREGLAVGSKEFGGRFDELYLGSGDDDETARYTELLNSGMPEEDVLQQMVSEGY